MDSEDLRFIQEQIGYDFDNEDLLVQAFTRRSYSAENGGGDNEVLEFIGDKALDIAVVRLLTERFGYMTSDCDDFDKDEDDDEFLCDKDEGEMTEIKAQLVQKRTLAERIKELQMEDFLITGKGDSNNNINNNLSALEDLFEAIIGAVAIDSNWDFEKILSTVDIMLNPDSLLDDTEENYVALVQEWNTKKSGELPYFEYTNSSYDDVRPFFINSNELRSTTNQEELKNSFGMAHCINTKEYFETHFKCRMELEGIPYIFIGYGTSKSEARKDVCRLAYDYLAKNDLLYTMEDEIGTPTKEDAINQLEILARKGYFSLPTYDFKQSYNKDGNPEWESTCRIKEETKYFKSKASSKKEAKKSAAFEMVKFVLSNVK